MRPPICQSAPADAQTAAATAPRVAPATVPPLPSPGTTAAAAAIGLRHAMQLADHAGGLLNPCNTAVAAAAGTSSSQELGKLLDQPLALHPTRGSLLRLGLGSTLNLDSAALHPTCASHSLVAVGPSNVIFDAESQRTSVTDSLQSGSSGSSSLSDPSSTWSASHEVCLHLAPTAAAAAAAAAAHIFPSPPQPEPSAAAADHYIAGTRSISAARIDHHNSVEGNVELWMAKQQQQQDHCQGTCPLQYQELSRHCQQQQQQPPAELLSPFMAMAADQCQVPISPAAAVAAGLDNCGIHEQQGPFTPLSDSGSGPNGLFGVSKERAEAAVPLEAAEQEGKRDRAATARRALAQKGGKPTSSYRGVTHHVRTGRWEAHIWLGGKQVYLGGFDSEAEAAMAYDLAAAKFRGRAAQTNFSLTNYEAELQAMDQVRGDDLVAALRRQSRGPVCTSSSFRGVTKHAKGRWEARIGRGAIAVPPTGGKKYQYLGLYDTEIEAAMAYDKAAVRQKGLQAITNFDLANYLDELNPEELQHYMQNCPPEAMEAASAAADAAFQQQQEAAAAEVAAAEEEQQLAARYSSRRGVTTRRAPVAAAAAWARDPDGLESNMEMAQADQKEYENPPHSLGAAAAAAAAAKEGVLEQQPNAPAVAQAAVAAGSRTSSPVAAAGNNSGIAAAAGNAVSPEKRKPEATAAAAAAGNTAAAPALGVIKELVHEQRQYRHHLLEREQQQQQDQLKEQHSELKQQKKRARPTGKASSAAVAAPTTAASAIVRSASLEGNTAAALHAKANAAAAAGPCAVDLPSLRRRASAPPLSAHFVTNLQPQQQASVNDFVMPDSDLDGEARVDGTSGDIEGSEAAPQAGKQGEAEKLAAAVPTAAAAAQSCLPTVGAVTVISGSLDTASLTSSGLSDDSSGDVSRIDTGVTSSPGYADAQLLGPQVPPTRLAYQSLPASASLAPRFRVASPPPLQPTSDHEQGLFASEYFNFGVSTATMGAGFPNQQLGAADPSGFQGVSGPAYPLGGGLGLPLSAHCLHRQRLPISDSCLHSPPNQFGVLDPTCLPGQLPLSTDCLHRQIAGGLQNQNIYDSSVSLNHPGSYPWRDHETLGTHLSLPQHTPSMHAALAAAAMAAPELYYQHHQVIHHSLEYNHLAGGGEADPLQHGVRSLLMPSRTRALPDGTRAADAAAVPSSITLPAAAGISANACDYADPEAAATTAGVRNIACARGILRFDSFVLNNAQANALNAAEFAAGDRYRKQTAGGARSLDYDRCMPDTERHVVCHQLYQPDFDQVQQPNPDREDQRLVSRVDHRESPPTKRRKLSSAGRPAAAAVFATGPALALAQTTATATTAGAAAAAGKSPPSSAALAAEVAGADVAAHMPARPQHPQQVWWAPTSRAV